MLHSMKKKSLWFWKGSKISVKALISVPDLEKLLCIWIYENMMVLISVEIK